MNITVLANKDLASNLALNYLFKALGSQHNIHVLLSAKVGNSNSGIEKPKALQDLAFIEQSLFNDILYPALSSRKHVPNGKLACFSDFPGLGVPIEQINSINCEKGIATLRATQPELVISIRFGLILKAAVLKIPPLGVINLHSGALPAYRGVMACFRAMQNGDSTIATTLHYIRDASIDTGDIISINTIAANYQKSYLWNLLNLYQGGVSAISAAVEQIENHGFAKTKTQQGLGNYYSFPSVQELEIFSKKGNRLFDNNEIIELAHQYF
ncbi:MAG: methionyl-tRNA formyltransferase [Paraglaciecola sp.]|jgi:methionyl-tRNA formyltransferase